MYKRMLLVSFLLVFTVSCASIFTGTSTMVGFNSEPSGAKVFLNGNYQGTTPLSLSLKRDKDYNILVKKEGYVEGTATITRSFNTIAILNLLSPLCWIVDLATGAIWKFDQEGITVTLEKGKNALKFENLIKYSQNLKAHFENGKAYIYYSNN
jgi:hypothetical protein